MGKIFNRTHSNYDVYEARLNAWESSTDEDKALAINLRHDYRISDEREKCFRKIFEDQNESLNDALNNYYKDYVDKPKFKPQPDFCDSDNLIADCSTRVCCSGFSFDDDFVTVMNLNGLKDKLKNADGRYPKADFKYWNKLRGSDIHNSLKEYSLFNKWLDEKLIENGKAKRGDHPDVLDIVYGFFDLLEYDLINKPEVHKYPIWVTRWSLFEKVAFVKNSDGEHFVDRWNQVVGVNRKRPTWQIIVKYPASAVKCIHRPSQLDGGIYPQHFPPPPLPPSSNFSFANGGHTVDLGSTNSNLLPEFIHQPIALKPEYYQFMIGRTIFNNYKVRKPREVHYKNLSKIYFANPSDIKNWMSIPI